MAKPVLLVHGAFTGSWVWDTVIAELELRGIRTKTVDLPSQGADGTLERDRGRPCRSR